MMFDIVWEDCIQEEDRVANREALLREYDQALATHTKEINQSNFKKSNIITLKRRNYGEERRRRITQVIIATTVIS